jgi:hypothetical protein
VTQADAAKILGIIKLAYPNAWRDADHKQQSALWAMLFGATEKEVVQAAVKEYLLSDAEFPPSPGQINSIIKRKVLSVYPTALEAWQLVHSALKNSAYSSEREFAALPAIIRYVLGDASELHRLCRLDVHKELPFEINRFVKRFDEVLDSYSELERVNQLEAASKPKQMTELEAREHYRFMRESERAKPDYDGGFLSEAETQAFIRKSEERMLSEKVMTLPQRVEVVL